MKKIASLLIILLAAFHTATSQTYNNSNSISRIALVQYTKDGRGIFKKQENVSLQEVTGVVTNYGYNSKSHELYLVTDFANCAVTVNNDLAKILKKSKSIPQLKDKEITEKTLFYNNELDRKIEVLNTNRLKQIEDSIAQAKADSIEAVKQREAEEKKIHEYRKSHEWDWVPTGYEELKCSLCDKTIKNRDTIWVQAIINDTIYYADLEYGKLDLSYVKYHMAPIPKKLKENKTFSYHVEAFKDSLSTSKAYFDEEFVNYINADRFLKYLDKLKKEAPYGFVDTWSWNDKYSMLTMYLKYTNLNKKTIKYIDVYFRVTNAVGDVRKTGVFKGTGPIEEFESASWDWDSSSYYVAGDASEMSITQITLTYMDGTKITLPKNKLRFN